jgi:hypothetical protein
LHPSVKQRFEEKSVLIYDEEKAYRPELLAQHDAFKDVYAQEAEAAARAKIVEAKTVVADEQAPATKA